MGGPVLLVIVIAMLVIINNAYKDSEREQQLYELVETFVQEAQATIKALEEDQSGNNLQRLLHFCRFASKWQDKGFVDKVTAYIKTTGSEESIAPIIAALKEVDCVIKYAGRNGMNRTQPGQEVTLDNIFLGRIKDMTESAGFWLRNREKFEKEDSGMMPTPNSGSRMSVWYFINNLNAGGLLKFHLELLKNQLPVLIQP